jgi:hypothetical protein
LILLALIGAQERRQHGSRDRTIGHGEISQQRPRPLRHQDEPAVIVHGAKSTEKL